MFSPCGTKPKEASSDSSASYVEQDTPEKVDSPKKRNDNLTEARDSTNELAHDQGETTVEPHHTGGEEEGHQVENTSRVKGGNTSDEQFANTNETKEIPEVFTRDPALTQVLEEFIEDRPLLWVYLHLLFLHATKRDGTQC
jgi:hypothetical protein